MSPVKWVNFQKIDLQDKAAYDCTSDDMTFGVARRLMPAPLEPKDEFRRATFMRETHPNLSESSKIPRHAYNKPPAGRAAGRWRPVARQCPAARESFKRTLHALALYSSSPRNRNRATRNHLDQSLNSSQKKK